jgi:hypothetical protein
MATIIHERVDTSFDGLRISWGGIWAGVLTVLGTLLFLTTLGLAVGISAADPGNTDAGALGVGAAIWSGLALLIALFVGGMAATRLGMIYDRATGAFEGALVWVVSFVATLWLASSGVQLVASGISGVFSGVTQTEAGRDATGQAAADVQRNAEQLLSRAREQLPAAAERAQDSATKTAWITFAAMLISLLAAIAGAMTGRKRAAQRLVDDPRTTASTVR